MNRPGRDIVCRCQVTHPDGARREAVDDPRFQLSQQEGTLPVPAVRVNQRMVLVNPDGGSGLFIGSGVVEAGCKAVIGANASNCPACAGTSPAPPASSPCAANTPAAAGNTSGHNHTTRPPPPDQPQPNHDHDQQATTYKSVAHPHGVGPPALVGGVGKDGR